MITRLHASRNALLVAGSAALLTFLVLYWIGKTGDRRQGREQERSSGEKRMALAPPLKASTTQPTPASVALVEHWVPPPTEIVRLTTEVTLYNSRGKEVKQFPVGKRLRVSKRSGDQTTIDYLGDEYTIPTASTEPSQ